MIAFADSEEILNVLRATQTSDELAWRDAAFLAFREKGYTCVIEPGVPWGDKQSPYRELGQCDLLLNGSVLIELKAIKPRQGTLLYRRWQAKLLSLVAMSGVELGCLVVYKGPVWWCSADSGVPIIFADDNKEWSRRWNAWGRQSKLSVPPQE